MANLLRRTPGEPRRDRVVRGVFWVVVLTVLAVGSVTASAWFAAFSTGS